MGHLYLKSEKPARGVRENRLVRENTTDKGRLGSSQREFTFAMLYAYRRRKGRE